MTRLFLAGALLLAAGCQLQQPDYLTMVSPQELNRIMQSGDVFLVDVHVPQQAHIKGTDALIPYDQIEAFKSILPQDKDSPIYLYCESGPMATKAAKTLYAMGYRRLFNLDGGAKAWQQAGYAFE
jgi:rhodanese-related sulfurtransferase